MNIEFIIHGVLSSGQSITDQNDKDYYKAFYCEQKEDILMTVEVVDRPHGVSTYYNYLRYNNVISSRTGSYFGMTVRVDGSYCFDVKNMYLILDNLFNKMIVGKILRQCENKYEYIVNSFSNEKARIEQQFSNMFGSFFSPSDFRDVSKKNISEQKKLTINTYDLTTSVVNEVFTNRWKLYLSTSYPSKQTQSVQSVIEQVKTEANNRVKEAEEKLKSYKRQQESNSESSSAIIVKLKKEKENLEKERDQLIIDKDNLTLKLNKCSKDQDIINSVKTIKSPITDLAALFAARFQEDNNVNSNSPKETIKERQQNNKEKVWLQRINCILGGAVLFVLLFCLSGSSESGKFDNIEKMQVEIIMRMDSILRITNPQGNVKNKSVYADVSDYKNLDIHINIKELSTEEHELTLNRKYTFEIIGDDAKSVSGGSWEIFIGDSMLCTNNIVANEPDATVKATYKIGANVVKERFIKIKKQ